jgi:hypothetical protein
MYTSIDAEAVALVSFLKQKFMKEIQMSCKYPSDASIAALAICLPFA